ncbi:MAG TPA: nitrilase-related carbon-nitrogen hydrolase [Acidimicrobiales bacterium]
MALFPGSFDPFHLGHLGVVEWAAQSYDEVVVGILGNPEKPSGMFAPADRARLVELSVGHLPNVRCVVSGGLTGELARQVGAAVIVRSAHKDQDLERQLAVLNKFISEGVPTVFAPADPPPPDISSSVVRELIASADLDAAAALVAPGAGKELARLPRLPAGTRSKGSAASNPMTVGRRVAPVRIAAIQDAPVLLDRDATLDKALALVEQAAGLGAQLVAFPEAFISGYPDWVGRTPPDGDHAAALLAALFDSAVVVGSATTQILGLAARRHHVYLSIGINEREPDGPALFATQLLFGPDGALLSAHRNLVPGGGERMVWRAGDGSRMEVVETPFGRLGTLAHREALMPLARAWLYAHHVDLVLVPAWDLSGGSWPATLEHLAWEGSVFVVGVGQYLRPADVPPSVPGRSALYGGRRPGPAGGGTTIVAPDGDPRARAPRQGCAITVADVDVNEGRHRRHRNGDRLRADVFELTLTRAPSPSSDPVAPSGT